MPRRRWMRQRGVFVDLAAGMMAFGLLVGALFPQFAVVLGVPREVAFAARFWGACLFAGLVVGATSWWLAHAVIGQRLRQLAERMATVGRQLHTAATRPRWAAELPRDYRLPTAAYDDLGRTAQAFNELLAALEVEHRFRSLVEAASDVITLVDADGVITFVSASVTDVLGWKPEEVVGSRIDSRVHPDDRDALLAMTVRTAAAAGDRHEVTTLRVQHARLGWRRLEIGASDRRDDPQIGAMVITCRDVTDRYDLQQRLAHQAAHDDLTGLPNRSALLAHGASLLSACGRAATPLAVVVMDLDRFKDVNDALGHAYGDRLLRQVAARLSDHLRDRDVLGRLGGDEFAVLMPGLDRHDAPAAARRLLDALAEPFVVDDLALDVEASMGVAVADGSGTAERAIDALLREADIAMYTAKDLKTGVEVYDADADTHNRSRLVLLSDLRRGMAQGQVELVYQPKIALDTGMLAGVEALVRWRHPTRGLLTPDVFLPTVEQTGMIDTLTVVVVDLALRQVRAWLDAGQAVQVAVNLSARCLRHSDLPVHIAGALTANAVPARLLRLELTESALIADPARALRILQRVHDGGVTLSIDDFGTGYSSMSYLRRLPVDELKVDRSFVAGMLSSAEDAALVRSVVDLGHNLGLEVVAEGIEDAQTAAALAALGCDVGQGYHFARPGPASRIAEWFDRAPGIAADRTPATPYQGRTP